MVAVIIIFIVLFVCFFFLFFVCLICCSCYCWPVLLMYAFKFALLLSLFWVVVFFFLVCLFSFIKGSAVFISMGVGTG